MKHTEVNELIAELKTKIIDTLQLPDITAADINADAQFVGGDMGIDSIDILELVMMVEKDYAVKIENKEIGEKVFATLRSLAEYILGQQPQVSTGFAN